MAPLWASGLLGRSSRTAPAALPVLPLLLLGTAILVESARPQNGTQAAARLQKSAVVAKFDPKQFEKVGQKAGNIKAAVDGLESGAQRSESKAEDVKAKFIKYTKRIRTLHSDLNELMVKRNEYAKELFTHIRNSENYRLKPLLWPKETVDEQPSFVRSALDRKTDASAIEKGSTGFKDASEKPQAGMTPHRDASTPSSLEESSMKPQEGSSIYGASEIAKVQSEETASKSSSLQGASKWSQTGPSISSSSARVSTGQEDTGSYTSAVRNIVEAPQEAS